MSRAEARRRLQEADPNLKIASGRHYRYKESTRELIPKLLSPEEAEWLGLGEMEPIIPTERVLAIEAKWSKEQLQSLAWANGIDPRGDKEALVVSLVRKGILDEYGELIERRKHAAA